MPGPDDLTQEEFERMELAGLIESSPDPDPKLVADIEKLAADLERRARAYRPKARPVRNTDEPLQITSDLLRERVESEEREEKRLKLLREQRRIADREVRADRWVTKIPGAFSGASLDVLPTELKALCSDWLENPSNAIFTGPTGLGKSWTAYALARELFIERKDIFIVDVKTWLDRIKPNQEGAEEQLKRAMECKFLFFEDWGDQRSTSTGWVEDRLSLVVDHRWQWELPMIITTNIPQEGLYDLFGDRSASRLLPTAVIYEFKGEDRRFE